MSEFSPGWYEIDGERQYVENKYRMELILRAHVRDTDFHEFLPLDNKVYFRRISKRHGLFGLIIRSPKVSEFVEQNLREEIRLVLTDFYKSVEEGYPMHDLEKAYTDRILAVMSNKSQNFDTSKQHVDGVNMSDAISRQALDDKLRAERRLNAELAGCAPTVEGGRYLMGKADGIGEAIKMIEALPSLLDTQAKK